MKNNKDCRVGQLTNGVDAGVDDVVGVSSDTFFKCILHHNKIAN